MARLSGTLGAPWIDYIVADRVLIRPQDEPHFSEKIIRLPHLSGERRQADCRHDAEPERLRPSEKRSCSARSMEPSSSRPRCLIAGCGFCWRSTTRCSGCCSEDIAMRALVAKATSRGIDPARLIFAPMVEPAEHLARLTRGGSRVRLLSLWVAHDRERHVVGRGSPGRSGRRHICLARVGQHPDRGGTARADPRPRLPTTTTWPCVWPAIPALAGLRARVRFACGRTTVRHHTILRDLERALAAAWEQHCAGLAPAHIVLD
jgi:hypothetical protein